LRIPDRDRSVAQDLRAEAGVVFQKLLRPWRESDVHPLAGCAVLCSAKSHSLNLEVPADEREQIDTGNDQVAAQHAGGLIFDSKVRAKFFENFGREKCNLALVVLAEIEVTIAAQATAGHTFHFRHFHERKVARGLAIVADEVVAGRNEDLPNQHRIENGS